jgi:hypothetical protein
VSARRHQVGQLRELLDLLPLEPEVRAHLDVALRAAEADPPAAERAARFIESYGREVALRIRYPNDPDGFLRAWRAGER